jgi:hypothetical protein
MSIYHVSSRRTAGSTDHGPRSRITRHVQSGKENHGEAERAPKGREGEKGSEKGNGTRRRRAQRRWVVPPPDRDVWPEEYRGERWKSDYAILFAGRCQLCAYSCPLPRSRQLLDKWLGVARRLLCTNHPDSPGELREVLPIDTCRNFKAKSWLPPRSRLGKRGRCVKRKEPGGEVQRIRWPWTVRYRRCGRLRRAEEVPLVMPAIMFPRSTHGAGKRARTRICTG